MSNDKIGLICITPFCLAILGAIGYSFYIDPWFSSVMITAIVVTGLFIFGITALTNGGGR